jgi:nitrogen regulatory protein P-II 1
MKEIKAVIQSHRISEVVDALQDMDILHGVTVSEVKGFGHHRSDGTKQSGTEDLLDYAKKIKLEIVVPDHLAGAVVETILKYAHTGRAGDGLIFVSTVDEVFRIRTGTKENYSESSLS